MSGDDPRRDALVWPMAGAVILAWMTALVYGVLTGQFVAMTIVMPAVLLLAGYVFGSNIIKSATKGRNGDQGS